MIRPTLGDTLDALRRALDSAGVGSRPAQVGAAGGRLLPHPARRPAAGVRPGPARRHRRPPEARRGARRGPPGGRRRRGPARCWVSPPARCSSRPPSARTGRTTVTAPTAAAAAAAAAPAIPVAPAAPTSTPVTARSFAPPAAPPGASPPAASSPLAPPADRATVGAAEPPADHGVGPAADLPTQAPRRAAAGTEGPDGWRTSAPGPGEARTWGTDGRLPAPARWGRTATGPTVRIRRPGAGPNASPTTGAAARWCSSAPGWPPCWQWAPPPSSHSEGEAGATTTRGPTPDPRRRPRATTVPPRRPPSRSLPVSCRWPRRPSPTRRSTPRSGTCGWSKPTGRPRRARSPARPRTRPACRSSRPIAGPWPTRSRPQAACGSCG